MDATLSPRCSCRHTRLSIDVHTMRNEIHSHTLHFLEPCASLVGMVEPFRHQKCERYKNFVFRKTLATIRRLRHVVTSASINCYCPLPAITSSTVIILNSSLPFLYEINAKRHSKEMLYSSRSPIFLQFSMSAHRPFSVRGLSLLFIQV
jgi:hypothetical protein